MLFHNVYHWTFVLWCETVQGCLCDGFIWPGSGFAAAYRQCSLELKDWMGQWSQQVWHGVAFFSRQHINHVLIIYNSINIVIWWIIYGKLVWSYLCLLKWVAISHHLSSFVMNHFICHCLTRWCVCWWLVLKIAEVCWWGAPWGSLSPPRPVAFWWKRTRSCGRTSAQTCQGPLGWTRDNSDDVWQSNVCHWLIVDKLIHRLDRWVCVKTNWLLPQLHYQLPVALRNAQQVT